MKLIIFSIILHNIIYAQCSTLQSVDDNGLMNLMRTEEYVVCLFTTKYCDECTKYEAQLAGIREDLVETLNAWVVKVEDSSVRRLYSPNNEPVLVFFRHGIPLLYHGPWDEELILHTFSTNKEPVTKELTDETFEHLTQAATGATTGDWFVMFYTNACVDCQRLQARWEAVGAHLRTKLNIARVNKETTGAKTARRFDVFDVPTFILFKQGKMYRYHNKNYDITSFVAFTEDWYKNVTPERVPVPKSPFDDLVAAIAMYFKENPWMWQIFFVTFIFGLGASALLKYLQKKPATKTKPAKSSATGSKSTDKKKTK